MLHSRLDNPKYPEGRVSLEPVYERLVSYTELGFNQGKILQHNMRYLCLVWFQVDNEFLKLLLEIRLS